MKTDKIIKLATGRPPKGQGIPWYKANLLWANSTDKEVQQKLEKMGVQVSTVSIFLKRKKMIAEGKKVQCKKAPYSRSKV